MDPGHRALTRIGAGWIRVVELHPEGGPWHGGRRGRGRDAVTTVTIKAEGTDLSGVVKSPRPKRCAADRLVVVVRQKGARGGGDDVRFATDTASLEGGVYRWSTGNTGTESRFYAKVRHIDGCRGDTSPTIRAVRNP